MESFKPALICSALYAAASYGMLLLFSHRYCPDAITAALFPSVQSGAVLAAALLATWPTMYMFLSLGSPRVARWLGGIMGYGAMAAVEVGSNWRDSAAHQLWARCTQIYGERWGTGIEISLQIGWLLNLILGLIVLVMWGALGQPRIRKEASCAPHLDTSQPADP